MECTFFCKNPRNNELSKKRGDTLSNIIAECHSINTEHNIKYCGYKYNTVHTPVHPRNNLGRQYTLCYKVIWSIWTSINSQTLPQFSHQIFWDILVLNFVHFSKGRSPLYSVFQTILCTSWKTHGQGNHKAIEKEHIYLEQRSVRKFKKKKLNY